MKKIRMIDNLNCNTQAHARVCEKHKVKELENQTPVKTFLMKRVTFKGY